MWQRIQGKCDYPCPTLSALLPIAVYSPQDALLGTVFIYKAGQAYTEQKKSSSGWITQNSRQMQLSVPCSECFNRENLAPFGVHRIQGQCGYLCLTPNALLRIAVSSVQARKCSYSEYDIRSRACGYTELSEVRPSYPECPFQTSALSGARLRIKSSSGWSAYEEFW